MVDFNKNIGNLNELEVNDYIRNLFKNEIAFTTSEIYKMQDEIKRLIKIEWEYHKVLEVYKEMLKDQEKGIIKKVCEKISKDFNKFVDDKLGDIGIEHITLNIEDVNFYLIDIQSLEN